MPVHALQGAFAGGAEEHEAIILSGRDWRLHDDNKATGVQERMFVADPASAGWIPATVPGNVQADLEAAHRLMPLSYGAGDPRLQAAAASDWWYRKDFTLPASCAGRRLTLVFDGVDQHADVWLNGQKIGSHTGMFKRFWLDVTDAAKPGEVNQLAVRIARYPNPKAPDWAQQSLELKSATNAGWDWGTPIRTLGIWKDVRLEATGAARIDWTRVRTDLSPDHAAAKVLVALEIDSTSDMAAKVAFRVSREGQAADVVVNVDLKKGRNVVEAELPLDRPALWWPAGQGDQPLYTLESTLTAADGVAQDRRTTRFGVRDVRWVHTQDAPENFISRYQLLINGRPVRTIGSNIVPADLYYGRMLPRALNLLHQAKAAGMNTLRCWGGGVVFHDAFYDLADELGILIMQEFTLANIPVAQFPTSPEYLAMLEATARNILRQVRNHPSIMEFSGGNEIRWTSATVHPVIHLLRRVVAEEDGRIFRATCPDAGATHGAWDFYLWPGKTGCRWYDDLKTSVDHDGKRIQVWSMRAGEFGSGSPANLEVWHREIPVKDQWPIIGLDNKVLHRKRTVRAIGPYNWLQKNMIEGAFGPADDLAELIEAGQFCGAEGLRYAMDALRRTGKRIGGITTWDLNEPWPNGAGSYLIDFDGRPRMNHSFLKQAIAPLSLSLKYESVFYPLHEGMKTELFLTSDAPEPAENLRWSWIARDRRGTVFARDEGTASIAPIESTSLGAITLMPPAQTSFGPIFMELRLEDSSGRLVAERLHIFAPAELSTPFAQLVKNRAADPDDDASQITRTAERPADVRNLLFHMLGESMTPPPSNVPPQFHGMLKVNDGLYGDDYGWSDGWFQYKLRNKTKLGRFLFGRDRTGVLADRCADYLKIELSADGEQWTTVFERDQLTKLPGFSPFKTVEIEIPPVEAQYVKVTVMPPGSDGKGPFPVIDEFQVYAASDRPAAELPAVTVLDRPEAWRPTRRTTLEATAAPVRFEGDQEVLEIQVKNTGPMTAFPCEIHPLISYRTELFIDNNHCFVPPGESRTITIRTDRKPACGLSLAQTGWSLSCWNADRVTLAPSAEVLLAVGRRDQMCREFAGYFDPGAVSGTASATLQGTRPDPATLPYRLEQGQAARFDFSAGEAAAKHGARLRLHTSDQSQEAAAQLAVTVNGRKFELRLAEGFGIQQTDPAHLADPATAELEIPPGVLQTGNNVIAIQVKNAGWFTWDAIDCVAVP
ncbi:MAG: sugar-binding domain-containing protein [Planctomycetia bacterium]